MCAPFWGRDAKKAGVIGHPPSGVVKVELFMSLGWRNRRLFSGRDVVFAGGIVAGRTEQCDEPDNGDNDDNSNKQAAPAGATGTAEVCV